MKTKELVKTVSLKNFLQTTKEEYAKIRDTKAIQAFPIYVSYSLATIILLKISQLVLGWSF